MGNVTTTLTAKFFEKNELLMGDLTSLTTPIFFVVLWENFRRFIAQTFINMGGYFILK